MPVEIPGGAKQIIAQKHADSARVQALTTELINLAAKYPNLENLEAAAIALGAAAAEIELDVQREIAYFDRL